LNAFLSPVEQLEHSAPLERLEPVDHDKLMERLELSEAVERLDEGVSAIRRYRPGFRGRSMLPTDVGQRFTLYQPRAYSELRTGYDRVIQTLSRLSQSLESEARAR
jgi:hypothetical protein